MSYEIYTRKPDVLSDRLMEALLEKNLPFAEIELGAIEAEALESKHGRPLPFVMSQGRLVGGFSDLVLSLRRPSRRAIRPTPA